jgi:hypothetical protein
MNTLEVHPEIHVREQRQRPAYSRNPALFARIGDQYSHKSAAAKREDSLTNRDAESASRKRRSGMSENNLVEL